MTAIQPHHSALTRRRLLVSSAALGAMAGMGAAPGRAAAAANGEVLNGSHWGVYHAKVEDGRFVSLRPWDKDPHPTPALAGVQDIVYGPTRIRYPMVRRAWLEKGPGAAPETRGKGDFVRVSWDQALDLVAKEIRRVQTDYGPWAIFGGTYGWRSAGRLNPQTMLKRLLNLTGGYVDASEDYSKAAIERIDALRGRLGRGRGAAIDLPDGNGEHRADGVLGLQPAQQQQHRQLASPTTRRGASSTTCEGRQEGHLHRPGAHRRLQDS